MPFLRKRALPFVAFALMVGCGGGDSATDTSNGADSSTNDTDAGINAAIDASAASVDGATAHDSAVHVADAGMASDSAVHPTDAGVTPTDSAVMPTGDAMTSALLHPGLLTTQIDISGIKNNLNNEPWKSALTALEQSSYASLAYAAKPYVTVSCGSYNMPNIGCDQIVDDGMAAYVQSLLWVLTGDQARAQKAISILNGWASTWQSNTDSNAPLVAAWAAPWYMNAAELLRHMGGNWSAADVQQFEGFSRRLLPYMTSDVPGNNWLMSKIEAQMAIAVFLDDSTEFQNSLSRWTSAIPTYFYVTSDGKTPVLLAGETTSPWKTSAYVNGQCMETCRDFGHTRLGFDSVIYAARVAWSQGHDLFKAEAPRLAAFMELHASWTTGVSSVPTSICNGNGVLCSGQTNSPKMPCGEPGWEIAVDQLGHRLGMSLPLSEGMLAKAQPVGPAHWNLKPETLIHGIF